MDRSLTQTVAEHGHGPGTLVHRVFDELYGTLESRAQGLLGRERRDHTLDAPGLVSEAYLRVASDDNLEGHDEAYVLGAATRSMRRVLVDHARARLAGKRGGNADGALRRETLRTADLAVDLHDQEMTDLDEAMDELGQLDASLLETVELRFFGGLTVDRIAGLTGRSPRSVKRDWAWARAWLFRKLTAGP